MKTNLSIFTLVSAALLLVSCSGKIILHEKNSNLEYYKSIPLPNTEVHDATLIQTIDQIVEISKKTAQVNIDTTNYWQYGTSVTVMPTTGRKKQIKKTMVFFHMTVFEAFDKIGKEFDLIMKYQNGRFVFSDPDWVETNELNLLGGEKHVPNK